MAEPQPTFSSLAPDLEELRSWIERMIASLRFVELVTAILTLIGRMREMNMELRKQIVNLHRRRPRSEKLDRIERQLVLPLAGIVPAAKDEQKTESAEEEQTKRKEKSRKGRHPGRAALPAHLERVQVINAVPPEKRICPQCGSEMTTVGQSICGLLDVIPSRIVVTQRLDERVACPHDNAIVSAPTPPQIVERGKLSTRFIVESNKYLDHIPIERQCTRWTRTGVVAMTAEEVSEAFELRRAALETDLGIDIRVIPATSSCRSSSATSRRRRR
jgi:transposase